MARSRIRSVWSFGDSVTWGRSTLLGALVCAWGMGCSSSTEPSVGSNPESSRFITEDIPRFWAAFDQTLGARDTLPLRRVYLDSGTVGLREFTDKRWRNAATLAAAVWPRRAYYASIRNNTLAVAGLEPRLRSVYRTLDTLYQGSVFPNVYFAIGALGTGGTTGRAGLFIGTELFALAPDSPMDALTFWQRSVVKPLNVIPGIVAHELVHYQQRQLSTNTLLAQSINEGSADFVAELLSGINTNAHIRAYGDAHEQELWAEFRNEMQGSDVSRWLYNGGSATAARPADLGYYIGYRITQAFYERAQDKRQAVRDILTIRDVAEFLQRSGYASQFP